LPTRPLPRLVLYVGLIVVVLHFAVAVWLGTSALGSLIGNSLQIASSFLAAAMCFQAARKEPGFSRSFWLLVGFGMGMWGVADLGWAYWEFVLRTEPSPGSVIRFLFDIQVMFFVMAIFLNPEKSDSRVDPEEALDFLQLGILFFFVYFGIYYLPSINLNAKEALGLELRVMLLNDVGIISLAALQWKRARQPQVKRLYGGLALYALLYSTLGFGAEFIQTWQELPTGTIFDLAWTVPLLSGAYWAANWEPVKETGYWRQRTRTLTEILINNALFFLAPLIILFGVAELGPGWKLVRFSLLGLSLACYAARVGITQYRQQKNQETMSRQTLAMDSSVDGISIINEKGVHVYGNSAMVRMLGFQSAEAIIGKPWEVVFAFQEVARLQPEVRKGLAQNQKWSAPMKLKRPDGSRLPVEVRVEAMPDGGTVWVCRDTSQHEQSEKARAEAETKYRMLVEHVNAITYIAEIGLHGEWYYVSPQVEAILGYTPEEWLALSRGWDEFIHPDDIASVVAAEAACAQGVPFQAEFRLRRKDGKEVWLSDTGVVVQGSDSHPVMEGIMVDITERKLLETQLQQSRKMEAVGRLAGGIAHDFNNLLTIMTGYTELALNRPQVPREIRADIERIENAAGRAAALVRQLLAFSRKQVLQPKILDFNQIVLNLDALLRRLMDEHIEMTTHVREDTGKIKADPAQIEQVIMNLVVNARDAMPNGGQLTLETANTELDSDYADEHMSVKPGRYVMLAVSDTGIGMSRETVAHIFEPFYTTKESGRGTGLGLSTVYGIVKQSGGYIWVYSEPGQGSTFKVYLPRVEEAIDERTATELVLHPKRGTETILVVEDEEAVRELIQEVLLEQGYHVLPASDPDHAEWVATNHSDKIHMLLTDMVMPGRSGRELAKRVMARRPDIRVLYMSGYTDNVITTGGMLEKGLAFLQKPFSPVQLVHKVQEVLNQTRSVEK
jgi:PAS domain S-box-containing protein